MRVAALQFLLFGPQGGEDDQALRPQHASLASTPCRDTSQ